MARRYTKDQLRTELAKSGLVRPRAAESTRVLRRHVMLGRVPWRPALGSRVRAWGREDPFWPSWRSMAVDVLLGLLGGLVVSGCFLLICRGVLWP